MINDRYYVKIVPQKGDTVHRFWIRRRHFAAVLAVLLCAAGAIVSVVAYQVVHARAQVQQLQQQAELQRSTLQAIDRQTDALRRQLQGVQRQNQEIQQLIGAPNHRPAKPEQTSWIPQHASLEDVRSHVAALTKASSAMQEDSNAMRTLAMRVLNIRHIASLARAREIAAIPSIDPVDGADVIGCFCYRTYPDVEFHKGVDLGADYGETVRASAAGTVVANDYDGAYGIKIDIDHGNGYHTWYAHLSRVDVAVGDRVYKGQPIAAVGATGFATGPHLHYQVMYEGQPIDPAPYLHGVPSNVLARLP